MSYAPVNDGIPRLPQEHGIQEMKSFSDSRASLEEMSPMDGKDFEQYTGYESTTHLYTPPPGPSHGQEEGKNLGQLAPANIWSMNKLRSFILAFDIVFHATPLMFIALSLIAARLDDKPVSEYGKHLQQVLLLSPTIFPVLFAALMGRCFKNMGLYLAERGTTLGRLEQLIGSNSLFSALERQISLRGFSLIGYSLMFIWMLSPLGGQSALRLMGQESKSVMSNGTVQYLNPDNVVDSSMLGASATNSARSVFGPIFLTALLSSSKYQDTSMDLWGNVRLPRYSSVENRTEDEWKPVAGDGHPNITYASLIGIPVAFLEGNGTSNFSVKARQWDVSCDKNEMEGGKQAHFGSMTTSSWEITTVPINSTCTSWPCSLTFRSMANNDADDMDFYNYTVATCKLNYDMFEVKIGCEGQSCTPTSMRKIDMYTGVNYTSDDSDKFFQNTIISNIMSTLPHIDNLGVGSAAFRGSTNAEKWMADPTNFVGYLGMYARLYQLTPEVFSERFTILWNTFFQSTYAMNTLGGNLDHTFDNITQSAETQLFNGTASIRSTPMPSVWRTNWSWFTVLLISSIILQIASWIALFYKYYTCVPDIIGYASSMTLLNPYVPTPSGGTTLHGLERSHMFQDMKVMIGDVCANEPVGAIAFAKADNGRVARLSRNRYYI